MIPSKGSEGHVFMDWLRKAPTSIIIAMITLCGVVMLSVLASYVILTLNGSDTAEFRQWVQTVGILIVGSLTGVNTVTGIVSARSASRTEDQTNGQLTTRDDQISALRRQVAEHQTVIRGLNPETPYPPLHPAEPAPCAFGCSDPQAHAEGAHDV